MMLGFLKFVISDFKLSNSLKALNCALVHSALEYGTMIWDPSTATAFHQLKKITTRISKVYCIYSINVLSRRMTTSMFYNISA